MNRHIYIDPSQSFWRRHPRFGYIVAGVAVAFCGVGYGQAHAARKVAVAESTRLENENMRYAQMLQDRPYPMADIGVCIILEEVGEARTVIGVRGYWNSSKTTLMGACFVRGQKLPDAYTGIVEEDLQPLGLIEPISPAQAAQFGPEKWRIIRQKILEQKRQALADTDGLTFINAALAELDKVIDGSPGQLDRTRPQVQSGAQSFAPCTNLWGPQILLPKKVVGFRPYDLPMSNDRGERR